MKFLGIPPNVLGPVVVLSTVSAAVLGMWVWGIVDTPDQPEPVSEPSVKLKDSKPESIWDLNDPIVLGALTTPRNPRSAYEELQKHLELELPKNVKIQIDSIPVLGEEIPIAEAKKKLQTQEWDIAFTTAPVLSVAAEENGYLFAARMFSDRGQIESALFVRKDSAIQSIDDIGPTTRVALGNFTNVVNFYMPVYDLYGKVLSANVENSFPEILCQVLEGKADVGAGVYQMLERRASQTFDNVTQNQLPQLPCQFSNNKPSSSESNIEKTENQRPKLPIRVILRGRAQPLSQVYLSPKLNKDQRARIQELLLSASPDIQQKANYYDGQPLDYKNFRQIIERAEEILGCTDWNVQPNQLFCPKDNISGEPSSPNSEISRNTIRGTINGYELATDNLRHLRLQSLSPEAEKNTYTIVLPMNILEQDPELVGRLPSLQGKQVEISEDIKPTSDFPPRLVITKVGQITILD